MTSARYITWNGMTKHIAGWADYFKMPHGAFRSRVKRGIPFEQITNPTLRYGYKGRQITWNGVTMNVAAWAAHFGISSQTMYYRLKRGVPFGSLGEPLHPTKGRPKGRKDKAPRKQRPRQGER